MTEYGKGRSNARSLLGLFVMISICMWMIAGCTQGTPLPSATVHPPDISEPKVDAPAPLDPREETGISLNVSKATGVVLTYEWEVDVDGGEIMRGQGSPAITYRAPDTPGTYKISVVVRWNGNIEERAAFVKVGEGPQAIPGPTVHLESTPTSTPVQTPTPIPSQTVSAPPMSIEPPKLIAPPYGSTAERQPPELQWQSGALPSGYAFVVRLRRHASGEVVFSPELSTNRWTPTLSAEKYGWWSWEVQVWRHVAEDVTVVSESEEWEFNFDPFPQKPEWEEWATKQAQGD
jgi:hypothetical protein